MCAIKMGGELDLQRDINIYCPIQHMGWTYEYLHRGSRLRSSLKTAFHSAF